MAETPTGVFISESNDRCGDKSMRLFLDNTPYTFRKVPLRFEAGTFQNVFGGKNNKTVRETLSHRRYRRLARDTIDAYGSSLDMSLGDFLIKLKTEGDSFYMKFLNEYGDLEYSRFWVDDFDDAEKIGVYAYRVGSQPMYVGRSHDPLQKRIQGYGKIHPKNCFRDGQSTNCRINALVTTNRGQVSLWFHAVRVESEIDTLEQRLIAAYQPDWNIQK